MADDELDVLLIEDNPGDARLIEEMLREAEDLLRRIDVGASTAGGSKVHHEETLEDGIDRLSEAGVDVVLLDLGLPESTGLDTLATAVDATAFTPIVVLTGLRDEQVGIEAIQRGAQDYLVKDEVTSDLLVRSLHHAIERNRQEREQALRHDQLEALNTLTRDLMDAETPAQVSEYVVGSAEEMLDLPITAVALYDEQEGTLRPAEMTDAAADVVHATALLDVGDGAGWKSFAENDARRVPLRHDEGGRPSRPPATELAIFPLARHGVLAVGSTSSGGFSAADFDFVETVAGNVEATFDRVARERQLHEREQTLDEQNRTLERLNRVNDIIRNIAQALVAASTREEIETVVCVQLADVGPYELAWIGDHDPVADAVEVRESAGDGTGFLDEITGRTDDHPEAAGPTARAVKTRESQVVNDILDDPSYEPWRRDALNRGYHATIALPLRYEERTYGVLNVYAGQPDVFDDLEQAVLAELADTIAYAIDAVESKKALVSDEVTRLEFAVTDSNLAVAALARELDCELEIKNLLPGDDGDVRAFFCTRGAPPAAVLEFAPRLPTRDLALISEFDEEGEPIGLFEATLTDESIVATVRAHGGQPHTLRVEDGTATVGIDLAAETDVHEFVETFRTQYRDSELVAQRTLERPRRSPTELRASLTETLTDRQRGALQTACFAGYFAEPRTRSASEVAGSMGIAQPTFNSHLRAAQRKLCNKLFDGESLSG